MEFYVKALGDPNFNRDKLQQDDDISMILTQIETILFTRKGSVLGSPNFGANLEDYVYELRYNDYLLKGAIEDQISRYVPLARKYPVDVSVEFTDEVDRHVVFLDITVDSRFQLGVYI
jgi:phage baseplate assembly protein W